MAAVNIGPIDIVLGMTGLALEKAGSSDAVRLVKDSFVAECTVCEVKITGAAILSEQRQVLSRYAKEGVLLYRGSEALAWENLNDNKCVKPGCNSTTYRLTWTNSETRHVFDSILSRFEQVGPHGHVFFNGACKFCHLTSKAVEMLDLPCNTKRD